MAVNARNFWPAVALLAALVALSACSSGTQDTLGDVRKSLVTRITMSAAEVRAAQDAVNAAVVADPEALRNFEAPILLVTVPKLNSVGVIGPLTDKGFESVWFSADNKSLAFRNGMIVASRGMIKDLESADPPDIRSERGEAVRDHYYRGGDELIHRQRFHCVIVDEGPAEADILGRIYRTRLVTETCQSGDTEIANAYWIGGVGEFRLSRQWISPEVGYVTVHMVQD